MTRKISRREFIKTAGVAAAATAVLTGCGPASRYVVREPYTRMPEYTYNGQSTYYASTCRECPAGCGIVVRTEQGRALKVEGNPKHPLNMGKTCSRGQAALQGLYNPDRIQNPVKQNGRGSQNFSDMTWDEAVEVVKSTLASNSPQEIAFLLGMVPDHLSDLVTQLCSTLGIPAPIRYGAHEIFDTRHTLVKACEQLFAQAAMPYFDIANADVTYSFGANFLETYLSPVAYSRGFASMRRGQTGRRGYLVQFEPRLSQTGATADEWIPVAPGTEGLVALAIGQLVAQARGGAIPNAFLGIDLARVASVSGVSQEDLQRLAGIYAQGEHPLAIPGGGALAQSNGLETAQAVLALNALAGNLGRMGGLFFSPGSPIYPELSTLPNSMSDLYDLVSRMQQGRVKVLFVHGINPLFELPSPLGFAPALEKVSQVISFSAFPDETSLQADYIFPDHTALESWGYQKVFTGAEYSAVSGSQPVVSPFYNTKATVDVLLAAVKAIGGDLASSLPYTDEVDFIQQSLTPLVTQNGSYNAPEIKTFMALFQQVGGWWSAESGLSAPDGSRALVQTLGTASPEYDGDGEFHLFPFMSPILGDGSGANKPWLQETPDPTTTVMWNTWAEINPATAHELGLEDDDVVRLVTPYGVIEAAVYLYPAIRLDTIAIPFGQGHSAYGRYAQLRGVNPLHITGLKLTGAFDLAYAANMVRLEKTSRKMILTRLESKIGVYGEGMKE